MYNSSVYSQTNPLQIIIVVFSSAGSTLPIDQVVSLAHDIGAKVLIDACQSVPHMPVDVKDLDADFLAAASHKVRPFVYALALKLYKLLFVSKN